MNGVFGQHSDDGFGVRGLANRGTGVFGDTDSGIGVWGRARSSQGFAGAFDGQMEVLGDLRVNGSFIVVNGSKSMAVPHPDGSYRRLYALESPESWFEDFGRGEIAEGRAAVELDPDYAAVVRLDDYHVFLAPEGNSKGLYVASKGPTGFEVREQQGGTSSLTFSYRVVARRKDIEGERLERVEWAEVSRPIPAERTPPTTEVP
jgi:hypothetical protein